MNRNFSKDLIESNKLSNSKEIQDLYEKKLESKIIKRIRFEGIKQQKAGYDIELHLDDGRILTIEEKIRETFYPDLLLEIKHTNGKNRIGWLYKSEAEILAYFQPTKKGYALTLWNLKALAQWSKSNEFIVLINEGIIEERWSSSYRGNSSWRTMNYKVPFYIFKDRNLSYRNKKFEKTKNILPLEFFQDKTSKNNINKGYDKESHISFLKELIKNLDECFVDESVPCVVWKNRNI